MADPKRYVKVKDFPTRDRLYVNGDIAEVIREYVEPASDWSGKPEIPMIVAVNSEWVMPLHLKPNQYEEAAAPLPEPRTLREKIDANIKRTGDWRGRTPEEVASHHELTDSEVAPLPEPTLAELKQQHDAESDHTNRAIIDAKMGTLMAKAPLPEIASQCKHHWVIDGEDSVSHCDLCGLFEPDLDAIDTPPIVRTLLDIAAETPWPRKQIILDAASELLTRKGE